jgi:hypothetical protein
MILIKKFFSFFIKDKIIFFIFIVSLFINLITWINLLRIQKIDGLIPLHYNIYLGIDYVGAWYKLFTIPTIGLIILILNLFLSIFIYFKDKLIAHILIFSVLFVQIILFLASLSIVWINT